jgi:hypothetical protein
MKAIYTHPIMFYRRSFSIFLTIMTLGFWPILIYFGSRRYISEVTKKEVIDLRGRKYYWKDLEKLIVFKFDESRSHLTGYTIYKFTSGKIVHKGEFIKNSKELGAFIKKLKLKAPIEYKSLAV